MSDVEGESGGITSADAAALLASWPHEFRAAADSAAADRGSADGDAAEGRGETLEAEAPVLLTLHGTGGNEVEIMALAAHIAPEAAVLSPRGRSSEQGMNRWFRRLGEGNFDVDDVIARAGELADFIAAARQHYDLGNRPIIAVGFSNGANIALATALSHPDAIARVVALSGMYPFGDLDPLAADVSQVRLLLLNGASDPMAPAASVRHLESVAISHGVGVERRERAGGHGIDAGELEAARAWIQAQL